MRRLLYIFTGCMILLGWLALEIQTERARVERDRNQHLLRKQERKIKQLRKDSTTARDTLGQSLHHKQVWETGK